jgi:hypothetical protein
VIAGGSCDGVWLPGVEFEEGEAAMRRRVAGAAEHVDGAVRLPARSSQKPLGVSHTLLAGMAWELPRRNVAPRSPLDQPDAALLAQIASLHKWQPLERRGVVQAAVVGEEGELLTAAVAQREAGGELDGVAGA